MNRALAKKQKPVRKCHSCPLNLGDHCWLHACPHDQWPKGKACLSFENEETYAEFSKWRSELSITWDEPRNKPRTGFVPRQNEDRALMNVRKRERVKKLRPRGAVLVHVRLADEDEDECAASLVELGRLADTARFVVAESMVVKRTKSVKAGLIGRPQLERMSRACHEHRAAVVIFDDDLEDRPFRQFQLALGDLDVIDRTRLILRIFARRAHSAEAKIQVAMAEIRHEMRASPNARQERFLAGAPKQPPRRQRMRGGIGVKGPGESELHMSKNRMLRRLKELKSQLDKLQYQRRRVCSRSRWPRVSVVGYTNAGKSSLLNALSAANAYVDDRLFATLDTKTRRIQIPGHKVLLSDTVGFISRLPHGLIASFRSTLDVANDADVLLVVADASDPRVRSQIAVVKDTLAEIGAEALPSILLLNKSDLPGARDAMEQLRCDYPAALIISAREGEGLAAVKDAVSALLT